MAVVCVDQHNFLLADRIVARSCPRTHREDAKNVERQREVNKLSRRWATERMEKGPSHQSSICTRNIRSVPGLMRYCCYKLVYLRWTHAWDDNFCIVFRRYLIRRCFPTLSITLIYHCNYSWRRMTADNSPRLAIFPRYQSELLSNPTRLTFPERHSPFGFTMR